MEDAIGAPESISCVIGDSYPVVDEVESRKSEINLGATRLGGEEARLISKEVLKTHGSRRRPRKRKATRDSEGTQQKLFLEKIVVVFRGVKGHHLGWCLGSIHLVGFESSLSSLHSGISGLLL